MERIPWNKGLKGIRVSKDTEFKKGHIPWNKGLKGFRPSRKTEFKKDHLPHNTKYDGCISLRKNVKRNYECYYIRINEGYWKELHRFLWERKNGKIPDGMLIRSKDGNSLNVSIDNFELIDRKENLKRNRNYNKFSKTMKELWRKEKLRRKYERPQQTKLNVVNFY